MYQFHLKRGLGLKKVHEIFWFRQSKWLSPFKNFSTDSRPKSTAEFEKDFYTLSNSEHGKAMEKVTKNIDVKLEDN